MAPVIILQADYRNPIHAQALLALLDGYARDPMGGATPLTPQTRAQLIPALASRSDALTLLACAGDTPVGLANCFEAFSTFAAAPVLNIHDLYVAPSARGTGIIQALLAEIQRIARAKNCCKITLEVLGTNARAQSAYRRDGFVDAGALFWQKPLDGGSGRSERI